MKKILNIENQNINFEFNEGANCWQSKIKIDNLEIEIEIDFQFHKEKEIDWQHFEFFYSFISRKGFLKKLISDSDNLVNELGKAFYRDCIDKVSDYKMEFNNSISYNGKTDGAFVTNGYSYSLIHNYFAKREKGIFGDEYGLFLVDIENATITGTKRIQC